MEVTGVLKSLTPKRVGLVLGPTAFAVLALWQPFALEREGQLVLATACWMVIWWVTEAVPLPVTALLPMLVFPVLGVRTIKDAAAPYGNDIVYLFFGGFILALGLEEHWLHKRIALKIIRLTGFSPQRLVLGFMLATALLSMWISNTATAVMMLPMAVSVLNLLGEQQDGAIDRRFSAALVLCIAYGANIGGMATLIGTPPNLVMAATLLRESNIEITFVYWMTRALPIVLVILAATYVLLVYVLFPCRQLALPQAEQVIADEQRRLGPTTSGQRRMLAVFLLIAGLWVTQDIIEWLLPMIQLNDTSIAILAVVLLFVVPRGSVPFQPLLEWQATTRLPWGILLLFGGGLSLADALRETGVIHAVGTYFADSAGGNIVLMIILLTGVALYLTEVMSNVALVTVFVPVLCGIASSLQINPLLLAFPATLASSCAFMLPISTPPNAIVFASGRISVWQMVQAGFWLNLAGWVLIVVMSLWLIQSFG